MPASPAAAAMRSRGACASCARTKASGSTSCVMPWCTWKRCANGGRGPTRPIRDAAAPGYPRTMSAGGPTVTFYGVRGSTPCDGHQYSRYGGNTSSVALEVAGHAPVIFDLGTGVRAYGDIITARQASDLTANRASSPYVANVLLTHLHWDHVIGLPF